MSTRTPGAAPWATDARWTTEDIPDQSGVTVVVTGANSGIGLAAARELARAGAATVLAVRDLAKGERARQYILATAPNAHVAVLRLDLADLSSVRSFAAAMADRYDGLDVLVNNAGVMAIPRRATTDGFEAQFGTNHLGHFALTGLLLDQLRARSNPKVVTVSSNAHHYGRVDFNNLQGERRYLAWPAYAQSKLANLLFTFELQRRAEIAGRPLRSIAAHPGYAATNLQLAAPRMRKNPVTSLVMRLGNVLLAQSDRAGALPILYAATVPELPGGSYVGPDRFWEMRGHPTLVKPSRAARDPEAARRLWRVSEDLTGVRYPF